MSKHLYFRISRDFPHGPVGKISPSSVGDVDSIPGQGAKISYAPWPKKKKKKEQIQ